MKVTVTSIIYIHITHQIQEVLAKYNAALAETEKEQEELFQALGGE